MKVFVNYRQRDSAGGLLPHALVAESLASQLAGLLGEGVVYFDTTLPPGERYADVLRTRIAEAAVVVVVIHPGWLGDLEARRGTHKDWVKAEISEALGTGKKIIPVLLEGAELPRHRELDADIRGLADAQAVTLAFGAFDAGLAKLAAEIELHAAPAEREVGLPTAPVPDRGRLAAALTAAVVLLLFGVVASFADDAPALLGSESSGPVVAVFALLPGLPLFVVLGVNLVRFLLLRPALWLDDLLNRVTDHKSYVVFGVGVVFVGLVLMLLVVTSAGGLSPELVAIVIVVSVGFLGVMGVLWAKGQDSRVDWPYHQARPTVAWVRAELVELERRLRGDFPGWRRPLPMAARRTAQSALARLDGVLESLEAQRKVGRRAWWRTQNPYFSAVHAGFAAATIFVFSAALVVHWSAVGVGPGSGLLWLAGCVAALICYGGAVELEYRSDMWRIRSTVEQAPRRVPVLRERFSELCRPIAYSAHVARSENTRGSTGS